MRRLQTRGERGAATVEHVGVIVLVVAVIAAVVIAATPIGQTIAAKICQAFGATCGEVSPTSAPENAEFQPPACMYREDGEEYSSSVDIGFLSFGQDTGFIVQRFADDKIRATVVDGGSIGAEGSAPGAKFDVGNLGDGANAGLEVDFGGDLKFGYGDTWEMNESEYKEFKEKLDAHLMDRELMKQPNGALAIKSTGGYDEPPEDPQISFTKVGLEGSVSAAFGATRETGKKDSKGEEIYANPNFGANAQASLGTEVMREYNNESGETSWAYDVTAEGAAGADAVATGGSVGAGGKGSFKVTRDGNGEVTEIEFGSTSHASSEHYVGNTDSLKGGRDGDSGGGGKVSEGGSDSTVTTTRLDVTALDEDEQAAVGEWLGSTADYGQALASFPTFDSHPDRPSDDPFEQLLYENATVSEVTYHNVTDKKGFDLAASIGFKVGVGMSMEQSTAEAVDAKFLGGPGPDGTRTMVDDSICVQ